MATDIDKVAVTKHRWLKRRAIGTTAASPAKGDAVGFRSDNDLHAWRRWLVFAIPLTSLSVGLLLSWGVPFRYSPLGLAPALLILLHIRLSLWRGKRRGRRFNQYEADDLDLG